MRRKLPETGQRPGHPACRTWPTAACWTARSSGGAASSAARPRSSGKPPWNGGRSHWGKVFSAVVAGGGFKGGHVVGASDAKGEEVKDRPVYPCDLIGSMYELLGIDPEAKLPHPLGLVARVTPSAADGVPIGRTLERDHVERWSLSRTTTPDLPYRLCRSFLDGPALAHARLAALRASAQQSPHIGYVYPAGGRQGTTFEVRVGGQFLDGVAKAHVSGAGVQVKVVDYVKPMTQQQANQLREKLKALTDRMPGRAGAKGKAASKQDAKPGKEPSNKPAASPAKTAPLSAEERQTILEIRKKLAKFVKPAAQSGHRRNGRAAGHRVARRRARVRELRLETPAGLIEPLGLSASANCRSSRRSRSTTTIFPGSDRSASCRNKGALPRASNRSSTSRCRRSSTARSCRAGRSLSLRGEEGPAAGRRRQCPAVDALPRRRRARLVPGRADALRRQGQGTGLRRQLPLPSRSGPALRSSPRRRVRGRDPATRSTAAARISSIASPWANCRS